MELKPIVKKNGRMYRLVKKVTKTYKPIKDEDGSLLYSDALQYLVRTLPQDDPNYSLILGLASFATTKNGLTEKQRTLADRFIDWYENLWED